MKNFMETNKITHNLMSFSGFKSLLIFSMLTESPKSYQEIKEALENNEYLKESVSIDTIRIYINSLRLSGCTIKKINYGRKIKYFIDSSPFILKITDNQVQSIIKVFNAISKSIELSDFMILQNFFNKIAPYIANKDLKEQLVNISPFSNINNDLVKDLITYTNKKRCITVLYYSKISGEKEIKIVADKLDIKNGKLYLYGHSSEYNNYSAFLVSDIRRILNVNLDSQSIASAILTVQYEFYKEKNIDFDLQDNEKIIEEFPEKIIVEISSQSKFLITQRILSLTNRCKVLSPQNFQEEIINYLKQMKEKYIEE